MSQRIRIRVAAGALVVALFGRDRIVAQEHSVVAPTNSTARQDARDALSQSEVLESVNAMWLAQRSGIVTVRLKARRYSQGRSGIRNLTVTDLRRLADEYENANSATDALRTLILSIRNEAETRPDLWGDVEFSTDGSRQRESLESNGTSMVFGSGDEYTVVADRGNRQALLHDRGASGYWTASLATFVPWLDHSLTDGLRAVEADGDFVVLSKDDGAGRTTNVVVQRDNGTIQELTFLTGGRVTRVLCTRGTLALEDGIVFPELVLSAAIVGDEVRSVDIHAITDVEVNSELREADLAVSVPADTKVFDHRGEYRAQSRFIRAPFDASDVVALLDDADATEPYRESSLWWIAAFSSIVFVMATIWLRRRRRPSTAKP